MPGFVNNGGDNGMRTTTDMYCPSRKKSRVNAPFNFRGDRDQPADEQKQRPCSIEDLPDECLFEILRRLGGNKERALSAGVSRRWLSLLTLIRSSDVVANNNSSDASSEKLVPGQDGNVEPESESEVESESDVETETGHLRRSLVSDTATDIRLAAMAVCTAGMGGLGDLTILGSHPTRGITDKGLSAVGRCCASLQFLSLSKVPCVTDSGLIEIAKGCPMLDTIELSYCPMISDKSLIAVANNCPNLLSLTIEGCRGIMNDGLQAIGRSCKKLKFLSIKDCPNVGDGGISGLVGNAPSLSQIKLKKLNISDVSMAVIGSYGKSVTTLVLTGLRNVAERGFWAMGNAMGLTKLKNLSIKSCVGITDTGLQAIAKSCPSLKKLCLKKCFYVSDAGLQAFFDSTNKLGNLELEECNSITPFGVVAGLVNNNTKLKTLTLVRCFGMKDICTNAPPLSVCESLQHLTVRDCPGFSCCGLAIIGKICPKLQEVELSGLLSLTDTALLPLIQTSSQSGLVKVTLSGCDNLTDAIVSALAKLHGKTLELLNLEGCSGVTDRSILAIAAFCSVLTDLDLSGCSITDYGVGVLASARQLKLHALALAGCLVTEKSLPFIANMGQCLLGLNLQGCNLIFARGIKLLQAKLRRCDVLS